MIDEIMHGLLMFVKCAIPAIEAICLAIILITLTQKLIDWLEGRNDR